MNKRKHEALDVVNMYARMTLEEWKFFLLRATKSSNIDKLIAYRYGLQAGLADANSKGMGNDKLNIWVINRIRNIEKCARLIIRKYNSNPLDIVSKTHKGKRFDYAMTALESKRKRDRAFENFLMKSNF
jgi:hypothetical protein